MDKLIGDVITITKVDYDRLIEDSVWLRWLEAAGVNNWEGIDEARDMRNEAKESE